MIQGLVNKLAHLFQVCEQAKYPDSHILNMFRFIQLNNYSCGIVSAFVILKYFHKVNSINEINYNKELVRKDGIDTKPLLQIIRAKGVKVQINMKAKLDDIKSALILNKPILISIDEGEHWVVIYGFNNERIFILDSSIKSSIKCLWTYEEFLERWDENWIAIMSEN